MVKSLSKWPTSAKGIAINLHSQLKLDNQNWHQLKDISDRRAAELLSGAIVQLLSEGNPNEIEDLLQQSIKWIKREVKAPKCPQH